MGTRSRRDILRGGGGSGRHAGGDWIAADKDGRLVEVKALGMVRSNVPLAQLTA